MGRTRWKELSRFTISGKTFFFNRSRASNDKEYLSINVMFGKGGREKVTLFPEHYILFRKHLSDALEALMNVKFDEDAAFELPKVCQCDIFRPENLEVQIFGYSEEHKGPHWVVFCSECREILKFAFEDSVERYKAEREEK